MVRLENFCILSTISYSIRKMDLINVAKSTFDVVHMYIFGVVELCMFSNYTIKQFISSILSLNGAMCLRMKVILYIIELLLFLRNIL